LYQISNFQISQNQFPKTLYLSQSYHPGWKAYIVKHETSNVKHFLNTFFPFIFGKEIKEHVLVNNWANGWRLKEPSKPADQSTLIIIFLPQYLEFLGFLLLLIIFTFLIKYNYE
jgi:hypothetical protein